MPRLIFFLAANSTSVDSRTNSLSIFEVIEQLRSVAFPSRLHRADFVALWQGQPGEQGQEFEQRIRVARPDHEEIADLKSPFKISGLRHRMIARLIDLPLAIPGIYQVELYVRPKGAEDWGLPVRVLPIPVNPAVSPE